MKRIQQPKPNAFIAILTTSACLLAVLGLRSQPAMGATAADVPWNYDTPRAPSTRPAWLDNVVMICESPWADSTRQKLKPHIQLLKDAGLVVMNMYPDGFCRLSNLPQNNPRWRTECLSEVRAMHALGMKVLAGAYPFVGSRGPTDLLIDHPEWRIRKDDNIPEAPGNGCLISPYGQAVIDRLVSRMKEFDVDGFQFDGWYQCEFCRCPYCLSEYKQETGLDVPLKKDLANPAYLHYMLWRDHKLLERMVELRHAIHAVKSDAIIVNWNNIDVGKGAPSWMPPALDTEVDWVNKEWWDSYDVSAIWLIKRLRSSAGDRPAGIQPYMFMRHGYDVDSGVYHGSSAPTEELLYRENKVLATGSIPIIWPGARQAWTDSDSLRVAKDQADFLPLVERTHTLKYAACLDSYTTMEMGRTDPTKTDILANRCGVTRALLEAHIPFDVLAEHNLTLQSLSQYKVLVLPNTTCMSDRLLALVKQYVANGGGLVATYQSSLFDEWGARRADFGLKELFGCSYVGTAAGASRIGFSGQSHPIADDPAIKDLTGTNGRTTYWGKFARITADGSQMISPLTGITVQKNDDDFTTGDSWVPLLAGKYQAGRVAYFPAAIDAAYFQAGYPYQRLLLTNAVRWAAAADPSVRVAAPMCVQAEYLTQTDAHARRTLVHLLNDINTTTGHGSAEEKEYAFREEIVPIGGITVTFTGPKPANVLFIPGKQPLETSPSGDGAWTVTIPPLALHGVVDAEYP